MAYPGQTYAAPPYSDRGRLPASGFRPAPPGPPQQSGGYPTVPHHSSGPCHPPQPPHSSFPASGPNDARGSPPTGLVALGELEFRRQALSRIRWESQEEELRSRVTMLENIVRRTNDLKASDVVGHERVKARQDSERAGREENERDFEHTKAFSGEYQGPFLTRGQVPCEGFYIDPNKQATFMVREEEERAKLLAWRKKNSAVMFLSGEHELLTRQFQGIELNVERRVDHMLDVAKELKEGTRKLIRDEL